MLAKPLTAKIDLSEVIFKGLAGEMSGHFEAGEFTINAQAPQVQIRLHKLSRRKIISMYERLSGMICSVDFEVTLRIELTVSPRYASGRLDSRSGGSVEFSDLAAFKAWDYPSGDVPYIPGAAIFTVQAVSS